MTSRERFINASQCRSNDRPPVWIMRQAGRYLPEYRALKTKYSFREMVQTPELAVEITLQPLKRFPLDAAILFSDILVIPEALGQNYDFRDTGGIEMEFKLTSADQIKALQPEQTTANLQYVESALNILRRELGEQKALLGFGGSPWTLGNFMTEGGTARNYVVLKEMAYSEPQLFEELMDKLTRSLIDYFHMQAATGVDAIQIFDSFGHLCSAHDYWTLSLKWIQRIIESLENKVPIILYTKGMGHLTELLMDTGANILGLDWTVDLASIAQKTTGRCAVQGNLDPAIMSTDPNTVENAATSLLQSMQNIPGHIFNLGHGILPSAKIENVETLVNTVQNFTHS